MATWPFFFGRGPTQSIRKCPGWGLNLHLSSNPSCHRDNGWSLTCCTTVGTPTPTPNPFFLFFFFWPLPWPVEVPGWGTEFIPQVHNARALTRYATRELDFGYSYFFLTLIPNTTTATYGICLSILITKPAQQLYNNIYPFLLLISIWYLEILSKSWAQV